MFAVLFSVMMTIAVKPYTVPTLPAWECEPPADAPATIERPCLPGEGCDTIWEWDRSEVPLS